MDEAEYNQLLLERQEFLESALLDIYDGNGTDDDWAIICFECGMPSIKSLKAKYKGN
jgi:hypothetical protein